MIPSIQKLSNGITLVYEQMLHVLTTSITIDVGAGSRDEDLSEHGLAHFLEHMAFKGTPTRTAVQIVEEIESVGGDINASTSVESTCYTVRVLSEYTQLAFEVLSDILLNPTFPEDEIEREKGVVLQELIGYEDMPDSLAYDYFMETAYQNQALGRAIIGTKASIATFSEKMLKNYRQKCYGAQNVVISVAGSFDPKRVVEICEACFAPLQSNPYTPQKNAIYNGGEKIVKRHIEQSHIMLGYKGEAQCADDALALDVYSSIVGGGLSSRLFQDIREKSGLAYSIYAYTQPMSETGVFSVYAGTSANKTDEVVEKIQNVLSSASQQISLDELNRAKAQIKASLATALESTSARADQMARHIHIYGKVLSMDEMLDKIKVITIEDVQRVSQNMLASTQTKAIVMPKKRFFQA